MVGDDPLLRWRDEFPILLRYTYLISNSLGAMPQGAYDSLHQYADEWASEGVTGGMRYNSVGGWAVVNGAMTWPSGQHTCGTQPLLCASMNSRFGG